MIKKLKIAFGLLLVPLVQQYIRNFPVQIGKPILLKYFMWRKRIIITSTLFKTKMKVRTNDLVQGYIYYFGIWEPDLAYFLKNRLECNSSRTFIDVGANVGFFSLLGSKYLKKGKVVSIEAFPSIYDTLIENIKLNQCNNVRTVNVAVVDKPCKVSMYHAGYENEGASTLLTGRYQSEPTVVEGLPLQDILSESEIKATRLIKIDTEGAEYAILLGLFTILDKMRNDVEIVVEITPDALTGGEMQHIFSTFQAAGFFPYTLNNDYSPKYYVSYEKNRSISKMQSLPVKQSDIIFSKTNEEFLYFA